MNASDLASATSARSALAAERALSSLSSFMRRPHTATIAVSTAAARCDPPPSPARSISLTARSNPCITTARGFRVGDRGARAEEVGRASSLSDNSIARTTAAVSVVSPGLAVAAVMASVRMLRAPIASTHTLRTATVMSATPAARTAARSAMIPRKSRICPPQEQCGVSPPIAAASASTAPGVRQKSAAAESKSDCTSKSSTLPPARRRFSHRSRSTPRSRLLSPSSDVSASESSAAPKMNCRAWQAAARTFAGALMMYCQVRLSLSEQNRSAVRSLQLWCVIRFKRSQPPLSHTRSIASPCAAPNSSAPATASTSNRATSSSFTPAGPVFSRASSAVADNRGVPVSSAEYPGTVGSTAIEKS